MILGELLECKGDYEHMLVYHGESQTKMIIDSKDDPIIEKNRELLGRVVDFMYNDRYNNIITVYLGEYLYEYYDKKIKTFYPKRQTYPRKFLENKYIKRPRQNGKR